MFNEIFVRPLLNVLFFFSAAIPGHDFGLAVILLTIFVRLLLWPIVSKQLHSQKKLTAVQPEIDKLKEKYKNDSQKLNAAVMELYKEKEVNPFSSCLTTLIQLPFLFALFAVFRKFVDPNFIKLNVDSGVMSQIYPFIKNLSFIKSFVEATPSLGTTLLGIVNLAAVKTPVNIVLGIVSGGLQFIQTKMLLPAKKDKKGNDPTAAISSQMTYLMPLMSVYFAYILPGALSLYWAVSTLFAIGQQALVMRHEVVELEELPQKKGKNDKKRK